MKIGGLVEQNDLTLYSLTELPDAPGQAGQVLSVIATANINLEYITESTLHDGRAVLNFAVKSTDDDAINRLIHENNILQQFQIKRMVNMVLIGIYGPHFRERPGIAARFSSLLGEAGVNIIGISSSISTVCCLIDIRQLEKAKLILFKYFELP